MPRIVFRSVVEAFWGRVRAGAGPSEAGRAVGVSEDTARRWFTDAGGVMPHPRAWKPSGPRPRLTLEDRIEIQIGVARDESIRSISRRLGRAPSTIKRELDNNVRNRYDGRKSGYRRKHAFGARQSGNSATVQYRALAAQETAHRRARRPKPCKLAVNDMLHEQVQTRLGQRHSPSQIARRLRREFAEQPEMWVSHEAIYQALYIQGRGALRRELTDCLRSHRAIRRPQHRTQTRRSRIRDMINISERPPEVADRAVPGHWESQWCCQAA